MARARVIVKRRKAVRNIRKITRTMQLIATSRFQKAFARATASKPYVQKISALVRQLAQASAGQVQHPLLEQREPKTGLLLIVTSNRGLCGGYNASVLRAAIAHVKAEQAAGRNVRIDVVGRKGLLYLKFLGYAIDSSNTDIGDKPTFEKIEPLADRYINLFARDKAIDSVHVAYMRFVNAGSQRPTVVQLLPLGGLEGEPAQQGDAVSLDSYDLSPGAGELLAQLLPATVKVRLLQYFNDAVVGEQVARMTAMKSATENAEDMIKLLTRQYNRARQSQITKEISEIIGGADALK
ncbi:MAG: ATP synthase F1 subunit gamma [Phycisphaerae bacterium]|nr:ATP synthase F1 subunit gamma [Phycisphaerae bacterium]